MTRLRNLTLAAAAVATLASASAATAESPSWFERLRWNAEERTRRGVESMREGEPGKAVTALDTALRLQPDEPIAQFNAGTARLGTGSPEAAALLESARQSADPNLAGLASYNLGNAMLESNDLQNAIEAYKDALRANPALEDARFNLELAQKMLQEQQQNQDQDQQNQDQQNQDQQDQENQDQQDQQNQDQQDQENQDQQDQQNQDQQNQDQENQEQQDQQNQDQQNQDQQQQDQQQNQDQQQQQQQQQESPLPQFQDLPDMTAEEAAAILEAIENLEREQRREKALEAAKANVGGKKDW